MHIELVTFSATAPDTGAAASALSGDTLTIRNDRGKPRIVGAWGLNQTAGYHQIIRNNNNHDTTRDLRYRVGTSAIMCLPRGIDLPVGPQEELTITISGSATAGDVETGCLLVRYEDLPGVALQGIKWSQLDNRMRNITTVDLNVDATAAGYASEAINTDSNLLKSNTDYAILGMETDLECAALYVEGSFTGNKKIGMPGNKNNALASEWFCDFSRTQGDKPYIPVFNSGDKSTVKAGYVANENHAAANITLWLAELRA